MIHTLRGRSRNGLCWRTGLVCLYVLNRARHDGAAYVDPVLTSTSLTTQVRACGGSAAPFHSSSWNWRPPRGES